MNRFSDLLLERRSVASRRLSASRKDVFMLEFANSRRAGSAHHLLVGSLHRRRAGCAKPRPSSQLTGDEFGELGWRSTNDFNPAFR